MHNHRSSETVKCDLRAQSSQRPCAGETRALRGPSANLISAGPADLPVKIGCTLSGRFEVRQFLGGGPLGTVWTAYDQNRGREIVLKVMWPRLVSGS